MLFFQDKVEFLGKVVTKEGISTSTRKIDAVVKMAPPENLKQLYTIFPRDSQSLQKVCSIASRPK